MTENTSQNNGFDWKSLLMGLFHLFNISSLLMGGLLMAVLSTTTPSQSGINVGLQLALLASGIFGGAMLLVPALYHNARKIFSGTDTTPRARIDIRVGLPILVILWALTLGAGQYLTQNSTFQWAIVIVNIPAVVLPVGIITWVGLTGLPVESTRRGWNVFAIGLTLGPSLIVIFEVLAIMVVAIFGFLVVSLNSDLVNYLAQIGQNPENISPTEAIGLLKAIILSPWMAFWVVGIFSVLVPIVEEPLKVTGLWLAADRVRTPAEGFALGLLSGAGYAVFESLGASSAGSAEWLAVVTARSGTSLLHILNSGLLGWALVSAWQERKFMRLGLSFTGTILIHGIWNAFTLAYGIGSISKQLPFVLPKYLTFEEIYLTGLGILGVVVVGLLVGFNRALQPKAVEYNQALPISESGEQETNGTVERTD